MKATLLKLSFVLSFLLVGIGLNAQQTLCTQEVETYTVDDDPSATPPITPSPDGSYAWELSDGTTTLPGALITNQGNNSITIDWADTAFDAYTLPATFTLTVIETVDGCPGSEQTLTISLIEGYTPPAITEFTDAICNVDDDADGNQDVEVFTLTGGTPGAVVTYEITSDVNGEVVASTTLTLDTNGEATVPVPALADATVGETFTLALQSIDDNGSDSCDALDIDPDITESVTVNPAPTTTPINFD